jgi:hypothetical protein
MVQEMHDQSFAYIVTVYGTAKMNRHKKRRVGSGQGTGTSFTLYISQDRQARRKQAESEKNWPNTWTIQLQLPMPRRP